MRRPSWMTNSGQSPDWAQVMEIPPAKDRHPNHQATPPTNREEKRAQYALTLFIYSERRSCSAWRRAVHSWTILSRRSSRVQDESAIKAAPLMIRSSRSSSDGRVRASLYDCGSTMIFCCVPQQQHDFAVNHSIYR